jgi:hypothetical protein
MLQAAEVPMMKSKSLLIALSVALAVALPAPSAQASELAKLGRLIVTGKRAPAPEPKLPPLPALRELDQRLNKLESGSRTVEAGGEPTLDDASVGNEPVTTPRHGPDPTRGDRVGRSPAPVAVG